MRHISIPFFRIFYSTTFSILALVFTALLLITPGYCVYQAYRTDQLYNVFVIAGVYLLTLILAALIYSTRLYANRSHLAGIPKAWMPIEKGDVSHSVRRMIAEGLTRSVTIAYESRPRDLRQDAQTPLPQSTPHQQDLPPPTPQIWGTISHPGWSSPSSPSFPSLHYPPIILELPHLIEAKAVSLAPISPTSLTAYPLAIHLLQRPPTQNLRDYLTHLTSLSLINPPALGHTFLVLYEHARFSTRAIPEPDFQALMDIFADILRGMEELDPGLVADLQTDEVSSDEVSEVSGDAASISTTETVEHTPTPFHTPLPEMGPFTSRRTKASEGSLAGSEGTIRTAKSRPRGGYSNQETQNSRPTSPFSQSPSIRQPSTHSLSVRHVRPTTTSRASTSSQRSGGSVIRLVEARGPLELPYAFVGLEEGDAGWEGGGEGELG